MLLNYLKIALRNLFRSRLYSSINILGLAIGLAACLMIFLWVRDELSYDRFHSQADNIFRVERKVDFRDIHGQAPITSGPYGPSLVRDYPEVEGYVRIETEELAIKDHRSIFRRQRMIFSDNTLFQVFDFHLEEGDPETALIQPKSIVLTREMAQQYLGGGREDILGRTLTVDWNGTVLDFQVTGILEEVPANSHLHFEAAASISTYPEEFLAQWFNNSIYTYVALDEGADPADLEAKLPGFLTKYMGSQFAAFVGPEEDITEVFQLKMKPLLDIHLYPSEQFDVETSGSMASVLIFSAIAALILVIACINFMSLSTARANKRAREVGMRKTIGALKRQLWGQFLGESVFLSLVALALAVFLIFVFLPAFNSLASKDLHVSTLFSLENMFILFGVAVLTGVMAGLYPAFYLTAFEPVIVLKGSALSGTGKSAFRRAMAVIQFAISITLVIGTLIIFKQMDYLQNKSLGFDKENMLLLSTESDTVRQGLDVFRDTLKANPRISSVSGSSDVPGSRAFSDTVFKRDDSDDIFSLMFISVDHDFMDTYGFQLKHGRDFSRGFSTDLGGAAVLNTAAVQELGYTLEEVINRKLLMAVSETEFTELSIIGVVDDFHFKSLHRTIEPLALMVRPDRTRIISVRILPGDMQETLAFIEGKWAEIFPGEEFNYSFLDQKMALLYTSEGRMRDIFLIFSALSIFVACLGLFGLAAFTAEERTKEIGVRKVLGASSANILLLLSKEFTKWVIAANFIAWPVAYYVMNRWMQNFAYRTSLGIWPFLLSAVLALGIALITVSAQSIRAALADPIDSLRYE
jgi:putative ABC transport system permease protein